jgi:plastocyanin
MTISRFAQSRGKASRAAARIAIAAAFALVVAGPGIAERPAIAIAANQEAAATVEVANFAFAPASVTINAGESVAWVSRDSAPHTATGAAFDTGRLTSGQPVAVTFDTPGEYAYNCAIHASMAGTVVVQ